MMSSDLPKIVSDEEFDRMLQEREKAQRALRSDLDRWDNAGMAPIPRPSDGLPESMIEQQFPQVAKKLCMVWPSEACAAYLTSLLVSDRETRKGFPPEVVEDLLMLHAINEMLMRIGLGRGRTPVGGR
jgi:hypothetical protein